MKKKIIFKMLKNKSFKIIDNIDPNNNRICYNLHKTILYKIKR